jgi:hypothetical protein
VVQIIPKLNESTATLLQQWRQFETDELAPLKIQP